MTDNWVTYRLGDIVDDIAMGPFGSNLKVDNFVDQGVPVIRGMNLNKGGFQKNRFAFVSEEKASTLKRSLAYPDDLVFTHRGTIGQVGIIPTHEYPCYLVSQSQMRLTVNRKYLIPKYLYYYFKSSLGQQELLRNTSQVGVPAIANPTKSLKQVLIKVPTLNEQAKIAAILSSLDDKIELNLQMNKSLESIAQAIFKEWFVDFNFPGSDGELVDGLPKGWSKQHIGSLFNYNVGGDWGKEDQSDDFQIKTAIIRGTDFNNIMNGDISRVPIRYIKRSNIEKKRIIHGDILLEISGGSPDQPTGRTIICTDPILKMFDFPVVPASFCRLIRPVDFNHSIFLSTFLSYFYDRGGTWEYQNQSTGISNFQFRYFTENKSIAVPKDGILINEFGSKLNPIFERHSNNIIQIGILSNLRDTILPKLLTGKIKVI